MKKLNKNIFLSILVSIGLGLSVLESSIPLPIAIPGARLGLSNMVVLVTRVVFGFKEGIIVSALKSIGLFTGYFVGVSSIYIIKNLRKNPIFYGNKDEKGR